MDDRCMNILESAASVTVSIGPNTPYNPTLSACYFHITGPLKKAMICQQFHWDEDIMWPELSFSRNHKII
jgi:hypothetical protein